VKALCNPASFLSADSFSSHQWRLQWASLLVTGFDHSKSIIYEHCKKVLLSVMLLVLDKTDETLTQVLAASSELQGHLCSPVSKSPSLNSSLSGMCAINMWLWALCYSNCVAAWFYSISDYNIVTKAIVTKGINLLTGVISLCNTFHFRKTAPDKIRLGLEPMPKAWARANSRLKPALTTFLTQASIS